MPIKKIVLDWLPIAAVITLLSLMVYGVAQQSIRLGANEPQAQLAHDVAQKLQDGAVPTSILGIDKIEISNKLASYAIIYTTDDKIAATNAVLHNQPPAVPLGIVDTARQKGEDRVTWQPEAGVRQALVAVKYGGTGDFVVVAGRSLSEPEKLIGKIGVDVLIGWMITTLTSLAFFFGRRFMEE